MPKLNEIVKERDNKKFVKKSYRPWDLGGDSTHNVQEIIKNENVENPITDSKTSENFSTNNVQIVTPSFEPEKKIDNTIDINKVTLEKQQDNKQITVGEQIGNTKETDRVTNREQLDINLDPTSVYHQLLKLSGIQKSILNFIVDLCTIKNSLDTGPIETSTISIYSNSSIGVTKISIKRLIDKGFIFRNKGKQAKGGYINLSITAEVYNAFIQQRKINFSTLNSTDLINSIRYQLDNDGVHSSSSYNKNITTKKNDELPEAWELIDFESLKDIGFTKTQIKQLIDKNDPEIVQESINHFAFGMEHNPKFKKYEDPLNVLMGVLRKRQGWFEKNYRSPTEIAQQNLLEAKKAEMERRQQLEEEAYKLAFSNWQQNLSHEELEKIAPAKKTAGQIMPQSAKLSIFFKENIWEEIKNEYLI